MRKAKQWERELVSFIPVADTFREDSAAKTCELDVRSRTAQAAIAFSTIPRDWK